VSIYQLRSNRKVLFAWWWVEHWL